MKRLFVIILLTFSISLISFGQNAWINEFHYDNASTDVNEFVEVVVEDPGSYTLSLFQLDLYNGSNGVVYNTKTVNLFAVGNTVGNYTFYTFSYPENGIQNGAPDGLCLSYNGTVIQFLSYEGSFTASGGPANGLTSIDIGVDEDPEPSEGNSLQLSGSGSSYSDFSWLPPDTETPGALNNGQSFGLSPMPDNPDYFSATAVSSEQIILLWDENSASDDVLVAYSLDGIFGAPLVGSNYSPSDMIPGGGEVIYIGDAETFQHTGLAANTQYFYRAWSVDGSIAYSSGLSDDAMTFAAVSPKLIISEVADPYNATGDDNEKFVEIFNAGTAGINFASDTWYVSRQAHGGSWGDVQLSGILNSNETMVIAYNQAAFVAAFGFEAHQYSSFISGNGDDTYALYKDGDHTTGTLVDIYGEINVDGTNTLWEYEDSKAVRKRSITGPNSTWDESEWVIIPADVDPSTNTNECTPGWHNWELTWNGGTDDWHEPANWDNSVATTRDYPPDAGCYVVIPAETNDPIISGRASCNNMVINTGAVVTVEPQSFLVSGSNITNTNTAGLIVESDDTGDGMLLLGSGTTQATIERYLSDDMSHFISAPTINATADDLFQDHNPEVYLYEYHEWDDSYNYLVPTSTPMPSGKGFSTWVDDASSDYIIAGFDGELTSADFTFNSSTNPSMTYSGAGLGWNLMGNPYPVPLNWRKGSWSSNNLDTELTVYIWKPATNTDDDPDGTWLYKPAFSSTGNFNGIIPSGQAFFVKAIGNSPSITIPANARTVYYPETTYYKSKEIVNDSTDQIADYVKVNASNPLDTEEIYISFNDIGTEEFDNGWDASKLRNSYSTVCLYIPKESRDQCIEHLPTLYPDEERIVEIGFETTTDGEHSIMIDATYLPDTDITLEDMKYDQMQNMDSDSIYTFVAFADDDPNRFRIHFNKTTTGIEFDDFNEQTDLSVQIYSYGKNVYIKKEDASTSGYVMLYDMYGREVLTLPLEQTHLMKIPVQVSNSYLVAKVISDSKVFTSKVYIK